jgi:hypothetical protein
MNTKLNQKTAIVNMRRAGFSNNNFGGWRKLRYTSRKACFANKLEWHLRYEVIFLTRLKFR